MCRLEFCRVLENFSTRYATGFAKATRRTQTESLCHEGNRPRRDSCEAGKLRQKKGSAMTAGAKPRQVRLGLASFAKARLRMTASATRRTSSSLRMRRMGQPQDRVVLNLTPCVT